MVPVFLRESGTVTLGAGCIQYRIVSFVIAGTFKLFVLKLFRYIRVNNKFRVR